jgi:hypothetical protein
MKYLFLCALVVVAGSVLTGCGSESSGDNLVPVAEKGNPNAVPPAAASGGPAGPQAAATQ